MIDLMTIDKNDNIYLADSYDKIKATIGENFVTDSYHKNDPAKKIRKICRPLQCHQEDQSEWHRFHSQNTRRKIHCAK